jgi:hypothetical protein
LNNSYPEVFASCNSEQPLETPSSLVTEFLESLLIRTKVLVHKLDLHHRYCSDIFCVDGFNRKTSNSIPQEFLEKFSLAQVIELETHFVRKCHLDIGVETIKPTSAGPWLRIDELHLRPEFDPQIPNDI